MKTSPKKIVRASTVLLFAATSILISCDDEDVTDDPDGEEQAIQDGDPIGPSSEVDAEIPPQEGVGDPVKSCYWRKTTATGSIKYAYIECGGGYQVLSGGCYNTTSGPSIYRNFPWEAGSYTNLPEDLEWATDVDGDNGWGCVKDDTSGNLVAVGMCCKDT